MSLDINGSPFSCLLNIISCDILMINTFLERGIIMLLTKNIIIIACNFARATIEEILENSLFIWGPGWVNLVCIAELPNQQQCIYSTIFGEKTYWDPKWGEEKDCEEVARKKAKLALATKQDTGTVIQNSPWLIGKDQYLFPGGVYSQGIAIGVSGAKSSVDEMIAKIVLATIEGLCKEAKDNMIEKGVFKM